MEQRTNGRMGESGAVLNALLILEELANNRSGLSLASLTRALSAPKTSVLRVLWTLEGNGYVTRDAETKLYSLGSRLQVGPFNALDPEALIMAAKGALLASAKMTGETAHLAILRGAEVEYLDVSTGTHRLVASVEPGERAPAHSVASGLAILSVSPAFAVNAVIAAGLKAVTEKTIATEDRLFAALKNAKSLGFATVSGEWSTEVGAISVPVFGSNGAVVGAIGISGPLTRFGEAKHRQFAEILKAKAAELSVRLTGTAQKKATINT